MSAQDREQALARGSLFSMKDKRNSEAALLGIFIALGLTLLGAFTYQGILRARSLDRSVTVKGLAEREVPADIAIWPIKFSEAGDDLGALTTRLQEKNDRVVAFLEEAGFGAEEISLAAPSVTDRQAQTYGSPGDLKFRYSASSVITVYTSKVDAVLETMTKLVALGKQGIAVSGQDYDARPQFLFKSLNAIKPEMIEEATKNAREVAEKFAADSDSRLGRIKTANQGLFSINDRDSGTPQIKTVRVVSTITYYLSD
jgi:hypothetical protein